MVTRYTAKQIADNVAAGMDPDVELVTAADYAALVAQLNRCRDEIKRAKRAADPVVIHLNNALTALEGRDNG